MSQAFLFPAPPVRTRQDMTAARVARIEASPKPAPAPQSVYPTEGAKQLDARILAALPANFTMAARVARCSVNKVLGALGLMVHRGIVRFDPVTAIYSRVR